MCIRDRCVVYRRFRLRHAEWNEAEHAHCEDGNIPAHHETGGTAQLRDEGTVGMPVSYTHLDVYKRQSRHFPFRDYLAAYRYIDANRETTMKVLIDVDESEA